MGILKLTIHLQGLKPLKKYRKIVYKTFKSQSIYNIDLDLKRFRRICENVDKKEIVLMTESFSIYTIRNTTIDEIFKNSNKEITLEKEGQYNSFVFSCKYCGGLGFTDWISVLFKNRVESRRIDCNEFRRSPKIALKVKYNNQIFYYSTSAIPTEFTQYEGCRHCLGTGILNFKHTFYEPYEHKIINLEKGER